MKRIPITVAVLFLYSMPAFAQQPAPTEPPVQHFIISANASGYGGKEAVAMMVTGVKLTEYVSVAYDSISNPTDTTKPIFNLGDLNVTYELGDLLPKKVKSALVFDTSNYLVTFQGSAGKVTAPGINHIAEGLGVYLSRPVADHMQMSCGFRFLHGLGTTWVRVPSV